MLVNGLLTNPAQYVTFIVTVWHLSPSLPDISEVCAVTIFICYLKEVYYNCHSFKYEDALMSLKRRQREQKERKSCRIVVQGLKFNDTKTMKMAIDFRAGVHHPNHVNIRVQNIEIAHSYQCMGTTIDDKL